VATEVVDELADFAMAGLLDAEVAVSREKGEMGSVFSRGVSENCLIRKPE
jgi:hypothetical protein